jgi:hypothetical protein
MLELAPVLFGPSRVYLDTKKLIGTKGKAMNIPDGYRGLPERSGLRDHPLRFGERHSALERQQ